MPTEIKNSLKKWGIFLLMGLGIPVAVPWLTIQLSRLGNVVRDLVLRVTDPTYHCYTYHNVVFSTSLNSPMMDIKTRSGETISWDSLPYANFTEFSRYCVKFEKIIGAIWIVIILGLVIYLLIRSRIWDPLKAVIIAPAIGITLWDDLLSPIGILLILGLLVFFIRTKKPWYFYYSMVISAVFSILMLFSG